MINRIEKKFKQLRGRHEKALIVYIMAGLPNFKVSEKLVVVLENAGADLIELGVPFSDPVADGTIIQEASVRALKQGVNLNRIFALVRRLRKKTQVAITLMLYYNLILHFGEEKFARVASGCGIDGIIVPDLPVEEAASLIKFSRKYNLATIFFVTPTSSLGRIKQSAKYSSGFIYYISRTGVTGAGTELTSNLSSQIKKIKKITDKPVCVGFGINNPKQVKLIGKSADGAIVGSAVVKIILRCRKEKEIIKRIGRFVRSLDV